MPQDDIRALHSNLTLVYPFAQSSGGVLPSSPDITDLFFLPLCQTCTHLRQAGCPCSQQDSFIDDALELSVISLNDVVPLAASFRSPPIRSSPTYPDEEVIDFRRLPLPLSPLRRRTAAPVTPTVSCVASASGTAAASVPSAAVVLSSVLLVPRPAYPE